MGRVHGAGRDSGGHRADRHHAPAAPRDVESANRFLPQTGRAIINDPVGALLAVVVFQYFVLAGEDGSAARVLLNIVQAGGGGVAAFLGAGGGHVPARAYRAGLVPESLKSPVLLAAMLALFTLSKRVRADAGLLTVTVLGVVMANMRLPDISDLRRHKE